MGKKWGSGTKVWVNPHIWVCRTSIPTALNWGKTWKIVVVFSSDTRLLGKIWHKSTVSGLRFTKNRPETHFLRDFMIIWLSVELAGRAKIWGPHPQFRSSTPFSSKKQAFSTNISLNFTFPGFTLLENDQKCTFYVILWVNGLLGGPCRVLWGPQPKFCTWPSSFTWILRCKASIAI